MSDTIRPGPGAASLEEPPTPHSPHRRAWDLIPWVVAGSATAAERAHVESHAAGCAECRAEIAFHTAVRDGLLGPEPAGAEADSAAADDATLDAAWQAMRQRLDAEAELDAAAAAKGAQGLAAATPQARSSRTAANGPWRWLAAAGAAALVFQAVGIAALSAALWGRGGADAPYQVLSETAGDASGASVGDTTALARSSGVRLVLSPAATMGELQAGLAAIGWQLAEASGDARLLVVVPGPDAALSREQALAALRAWPHTLLAEPMPAAAAPGR